MNAPESIVAASTPHWRDASFLQGLGAHFGTDLPPQAVSAPQWVVRSDALARSLGLTEWLQTDDALAVLAGTRIAQGSRPHASVYAGHQFGVWAGQLGDGRALMLGEIDTPLGPMEVQLKGSGLTPYDALRTATVAPAVFLHRRDEFGTIAPGKRADLLLVDGNPLESIGRLQRPLGVMTRGRWFTHEHLEGMLTALSQEP